MAVADAILRTQPEQQDLAADRINDALEAEDHEGVDLDRVKQAQAAFEAGDMEKTEVLLEQALGACPGEPVTNLPGHTFILIDPTGRITWRGEYPSMFVPTSELLAKLRGVLTTPAAATAGRR